MKSNGFTLLEIMIALVVFATLAVITATAMQQAFQIRERVSLQAERLSELQLTISMIERDTQQILDRSILGTEMHLFPPMIGQPEYFEFTRGGIANPLFKERRSNLQRIAYLCKNDHLIRRTWLRVDTPDRNQYKDKNLLKHVNHCQFSYITHSRQTLASWQAYALQLNQTKETLPMAVQFKFNFANWGNLSLLFILPEGLYDGEI